MANYIPVEVSDKMDLKCAMETGSVVNVITDKEFFSVMDGEIAKDKTILLLVNSSFIDFSNFLTDSFNLSNSSL